MILELVYYPTTRISKPGDLFDRLPDQEIRAAFNSTHPKRIGLNSSADTLKKDDSGRVLFVMRIPLPFPVDDEFVDGEFTNNGERVAKHF